MMAGNAMGTIGLGKGMVEAGRGSFQVGGVKTGCRDIVRALAWAGLVAVGGCCEGGAGETANAAPSADLAEEDAQDAKRAATVETRLDQVIECYNRTNRLLRLVGMYFDSLQGGEPSAKRIPQVELPVEDAPKACVEAKGEGQPAIAEVDGMLGEYVLGVTGLERDLTDLHGYWGGERYKGDGFRGARELHARLTRDRDAFEAMHTKLGGIVEAAEDRREEQEIERGAGVQDLRHWQRVFQREAKLLVREARRATVDAQAVDGQRARLEGSYARMVERAKAHPEESGRAKLYVEFEGRSTEFMQAARAWKPGGKAPEQSRKLVETFNTMVDALNAVKWN